MNEKRQTLGPISGNSIRMSLMPNGNKSKEADSRMSMAPTSRKSSFGVGNNRNTSIGGRPSLAFNSDNKKPQKQDPRPLADKKFKDESIRMIIIYLRTHNFPGGHIDPKNLSSPSQKVFISVLEFLFQQICPNYTFQKVDDEVLNLFKVLKYPYFNNHFKHKNNFSPGSPHIWNSLLGALRWLVELLNYLDVLENEETEKKPVSFESSTYFMNYCLNSYALFMRNEDYEAPHRIFQANIAEKYHTVEEETNQLIALKEKIEREYHQLTSIPDPLTSVTKRKQQAIFDMQKFSDYSAELDAYNERLRKKLEKLKLELQSCENELKTSKQEKIKLQNIYDNQELTSQDVERINNEKVQLEEQLLAIHQQKEVFEKAINNKEIQITKQTDEVDKLVKKYNETARALQLIPSNSKYANGVDFYVTFNSVSCDSTVENLRNSIKNALDTLHEELNHSTENAQDEYITLKDKIDRTLDAITELQEQIRNHNSKATKLEDLYNQEKEKIAEHLKQREKEIEKIRKQIIEIREDSQQCFYRSQHSLEAQQTEYEQIKYKLNLEKEELSNALLATLDVLASYKEYVQENLAMLKKIYITAYNQATSQL